MTAGNFCVHCNQPESAHGTQGWCDAAITGMPPGTCRFHPLPPAYVEAFRGKDGDPQDIDSLDGRYDEEAQR